MIEAWFQPDKGYVLQGSVYDTPTWLSDMQCAPALVIADPPYGDITSEDWDIAEVNKWVTLLSDLGFLVAPGTPIYWWGGIGKPNNRPLLEFLRLVEMKTDWRARDWITWRKKRAYGKSNDYLFVREECLLFTMLGVKPRIFNIPLSSELRGYAGYNKKYPAKSEYKRITNVWDDTEVMRDKMHPTQKASAVIRRPIEVNTVGGELVLDLFAGSGETSVQAALIGRQHIAVESKPEYCKLIASRLDEVYKGVTHETA